MAKKVIPDTMVNELSGGSSLFTRSPTPKPMPTASSKPPKRTIKRKVASNTPIKKESEQSINHDSVIALIRSAVKETGKETSYHRLTTEEKSKLEDVIYTYKKQGYRLSENEVARIAINWLMEDYKQNGKNSILDLVIESLKA